MMITIASITVHRFFLLVEMSTGIQIISYEVSQPHDSHMMQLTGYRVDWYQLLRAQLFKLIH